MVEFLIDVISHVFYSIIIVECSSRFLFIDRARMTTFLRSSTKQFWLGVFRKGCSGGDFDFFFHKKRNET